MEYIKILNDDGTSNPDMILCGNGLELRRAPTPQWAEYETHLANGGTVLNTMSRDAWAKINRHGRMRSRHARPPGPEIPLPPAPPVPPPDPPRVRRFVTP